MGRKKRVLLQNTNNDIGNGTDKDITLSSNKLRERERELKLRQIPNLHPSKKLRSSDLQRIVQHTDTSIFDPDKCCIWTGYITNLKNKRKGTYINFYFRDKKKVALHRLLYANFKGEINEKDYIKYSCPNKGKCCNINHMVRFEYNCDGKDEDQSDDDDKQDSSSEDVESYDEDDFKIRIF